MLVGARRSKLAAVVNIREDLLLLLLPFEFYAKEGHHCELKSWIISRDISSITDSRKIESAKISWLGFKREREGPRTV
jgi:hypothetical protein